MDLSEQQKKQQLMDVLTAICETLELSESQYYDAKMKYHAVGEWLGSPDSELYPYVPKIYSQGSMRIGTMVRPWKYEEFDLDLVCQLQAPREIGQNTLKEMVGRRLRKHEKYQKMLEAKNRCWRLNYAGEFHMDILPAIPDNLLNGTNILVPDRKLQEWKESNPVGYSEWFYERMKIAKTHIFEQMKADVENLPKNDRFIKTPLQRVVQILKRQRDLRFNKNMDDAPISIVITTLAAKSYRNEFDLLSALFNIIDGIPRQIDMESGKPKVFNPVNPNENFADKWEKNPYLYNIFIDWLVSLKHSLLTIPLSDGVQAISDSLVPIFGESVTKAGVKRYADKYRIKREGGRLSTAKGTAMLGSVGASIPRHTFYGR